MKIVKYGSIVLLVILAAFLYQKRTKHRYMIGDVKNKIKGAWMLQKEFRSPWKAVLVPIFFDFDSKADSVVVRGYSDESISKYTWSFEDGHLKIGNAMNWEIAELSNEKLSLSIGGDEYTYYRLAEKSQLPSEKELQKKLVSNKWIMDGNVLEFTDESVPINNSYKMVEYQGDSRFFGSYTFDKFKNNLFLILLIDGKYMELVFKVIEIKDSSLELQTASGNTIGLIKKI